MRRTFILFGGGNRILFESRRGLDGNWSAPTPLIDPGTNTTNFRRTAAVVGDTAYCIYPQQDVGLKFLYYKPGQAWPTPYFTVAPPASDEKETITSSKSGVYVFFDTDVNVTTMRRKVIALSGSITENMFWTGYNWISGDVTIESGNTVAAKSRSVTTVLANKKIVVKSGATLIAEDSSQFKFESGASIEVQGTLIVQGTSAPSGRVTFTPSGTLSWKGMVAESGSSVSLTYADIMTCPVALTVKSDAEFSMSNCTVSNVKTGIQFVAGSEPGQMNVVSDNTIESVIHIGVQATGVSNFLLQGNTITGTPGPRRGVYGVSLISASPQLLQNTIQGFTVGLNCASASSPMLENDLYGGCNFITENDTGVVCQDQSEAILGFLSGALDDEGGQNRIHTNEFFDVVLRNSTPVFAHNNWWGTPEDPSSQFLSEDGSELEYSPWLLEVPVCGGQNIAVSGSTGDDQKGNDDPSLSPGSELMEQALAERGRHHYVRAINILRSIVATTSLPQGIRQWAVRQLLAIAQNMRGANLSTYLEAAITAHPNLARQMRAVLPYALWHEGSALNAMAAFDANIQQYPSSEVECAALYGKFVHALYAERNTSQATDLYTRLNTRYPQSTEVFIAEIQLENDITSSGGGANPPLPGGKSAALDGQAALPKRFDLAQNYPNPFNPTTQISFSVPADGMVSLTVHDILGREIARLVYGTVKAGEHSASFDGSVYSSGVYFYRLATAGQVLTRKMLLVK